MKRYGFTLFRLFFVLAVAGLVVGGLAIKQSMQQHAEVRTLMAETEKTMAAMGQFRSKYGQLPGDYDSAIVVWGRDERCPEAEGNMGPAFTPGTCNGDGNGRIESTAMMPTTTSEFFQFWRHMALAGMIEGNYTGLTGSNYAQCIPGENCPALPARGATAIPSEFNWADTGRNGWWGTGTTGTGNWLVIGQPTDGLSWPFMPVLSAKEQADLDTKQDDGKPASGKLMAMGCQLYQSGCMVDASGNEPTQDCDEFAKVAQYQTSKPGLTCTPMFRLTDESHAPVHE